MCITGKLKQYHLIIKARYVNKSNKIVSDDKKISIGLEDFSIETPRIEKMSKLVPAISAGSSFAALLLIASSMFTAWFNFTIQKGGVITESDTVFLYPYIKGQGLFHIPETHVGIIVAVGALFMLTSFGLSIAALYNENSRRQFFITSAVLSILTIACCSAAAGLVSKYQYSNFDTISASTVTSTFDIGFYLNVIANVPALTCFIAPVLEFRSSIVSTEKKTTFKLPTPSFPRTTSKPLQPKPSYGFFGTDY